MIVPNSRNPKGITNECFAVMYKIGFNTNNYIQGVRQENDQINVKL